MVHIDVLEFLRRASWGPIVDGCSQEEVRNPRRARHGRRHLTPLPEAFQYGVTGRGTLGSPDEDWKLVSIHAEWHVGPGVELTFIDAIEPFGCECPVGGLHAVSYPGVGRL